MRRAVSVAPEEELLPDELPPDELPPDELPPESLLPDELLPDELVLPRGSPRVEELLELCEEPLLLELPGARVVDESARIPVSSVTAAVVPVPGPSSALPLVQPATTHPATSATIEPRPRERDSRRCSA